MCVTAKYSEKGGGGKKKEKGETPPNVTSVIRGSIRVVHVRGYNYTGVDTC
jgi:hypothetical protein